MARGSQKRTVSSLLRRSGPVTGARAERVLKRSPAAASARSAISVNSVSGSRSFITNLLAPAGAGDGVQVRRQSVTLPFEQQLVYEVVADVGRYNEFLPWCSRSTVLSTGKCGKTMDAELSVGFRGIFSEQYTSHVTFDAPHRVTACASGTRVFRVMNNEWQVLRGKEPGTTRLLCQVEYAFQSPAYSVAASMFVDEVVSQMVNAFSARTRSIAHEQGKEPAVREEGEVRRSAAAAAVSAALGPTTSSTLAVAGHVVKRAMNDVAEHQDGAQRLGAAPPLPRRTTFW